LKHPRMGAGRRLVTLLILCWAPAALGWLLAPAALSGGARRPPPAASLAAMADAGAWVQSAVRSNRLGVLTLDRPKALNAADAHVTAALLAALDEWERDQAVQALLLRSSSERAFCSGGDVKAIAVDLQADASSQTPYTALSNEYRLLCRLHRWSASYVPSVAIMDGVTMGFGVGLACGARYRIVTERTLLAMPENAIGLFPDIGFAYLTRDHPIIGLYLALTGTRIGAKASPAADIIALGIGTHYVPSESVAGLVAALEAADLQRSEADADRVVQAILADFSQDCPDASSFDVLKPMLQRCFNPEDKTSVVEILSALQAEAGEACDGEASPAVMAARAALSALGTAAPTSLALTLAHFRDISSKMKQGTPVLLPDVLATGKHPHEARDFLAISSRFPRDFLTSLEPRLHHT
jgi:enoyl-CoA hydratase/carnithine racemase